MSSILAMHIAFDNDSRKDIIEGTEVRDSMV